MKKNNIIHDFDSLPKHLVSKCPNCEALYNNAEDENCLKCGHKFFRDGFRPRGMTEKDMKETLDNAKNITPEIRESIKEDKKRKNRFWTWVGKMTKSFFIASYFSLLFLNICFLFSKSANNFSYSQKAIIGNVNLWRIVLIFGLLCLIATIFFIIKKKKQLSVIIFLWIFWILGTSLVFLTTYKSSSGIQLSMPDLAENSFHIDIISIISRLWYFVWLLGIYYCYRIAKRLKMNEGSAIVAGVFLPVLSILLYTFFSYRNKNKKERIRSLKILASTILVLAFISAGMAYYIIGTPEYSLYQLRKSIVSNNEEDFSRYFDLQSVANGFNEQPSQTKQWIDDLNTSVLEIKEQNSDRSKDADAYIATGLSGKNLKKASLGYSNNGGANILLDFDEKGAELFADITKRNIGKELAIFLSGNLVSAPVAQGEITNGQAVISGLNIDQTEPMVYAINTEKDSQINGFEIRRREINGKTAKITIGKNNNASGFEIEMSQIDGRLWKATKINTIIIENSNEKLPVPEGEKQLTFDWKYKGKDYSIDEKLYDSYYKFYNSLPAQSIFNGESMIGVLEKRNELFITENSGDKTISDLAQTLKSLGEKNNLNEDQIVELVASFVQTIPYDYEEYNNRYSGTNKIDYPYEVLYKNKGVCSDKSYLAYSLLKDLGYGVSFFQFPEDQHIAVGVQCPADYSNYDSGYCFLETTSLGNKIGSTPNISEEFGIATAKVELSDFSNDSTESEYNPLGKIEIINKTAGKEYAGIIETVKIQKELDDILATIRRMDNELYESGMNIDFQRENIGFMEEKLKKMENNLDYDNYDKYKDYYDEYKDKFSKLKSEIKKHNDKVASRNQLNNKYKSLSNSFYQ